MSFHCSAVLRGTRLLTPCGEASVESLNTGDRVVTRFGGIRLITWIGHYQGDQRETGDERTKFPVCIHAGAIARNRPARDLIVSPACLLLVEDTLVPAQALVNGITVTQDTCPLRLDYFSLDLGSHDCVIADGTWVESFADCPDGTPYGSRGAFHNLESFYALYPDRPPAEEMVLCAPRPERGAALEAVLLPMVARASEGLLPGKLQGFIEAVVKEWHVEGWAHDPDHPDLPVLLNVFLGDKQIGSTLAHAARADLNKAGMGQGRCAFRFPSPVRLRPELQPTLRVVRAVDGANLPLCRPCAEAIDRLLSEPVQTGLRLVV